MLLMMCSSSLRRSARRGSCGSRRAWGCSACGARACAAAGRRPGRAPAIRADRRDDSARGAAVPAARSPSVTATTSAVAADAGASSRRDQVRLVLAHVSPHVSHRVAFGQQRARARPGPAPVESSPAGAHRPAVLIARIERCAHVVHHGALRSVEAVPVDDQGPDPTRTGWPPRPPRCRRRGSRRRCPERPRPRPTRRCRPVRRGPASPTAIRSHRKSPSTHSRPGPAGSPRRTRSGRSPAGCRAGAPQHDPCHYGNKGPAVHTFQTASPEPLGYGDHRLAAHRVELSAAVGPVVAALALPHDVGQHLRRVRYGDTSAGSTSCGDLVEQGHQVVAGELPGGLGRAAFTIGERLAMVAGRPQVLALGELEVEQERSGSISKGTVMPCEPATHGAMVRFSEGLQRGGRTSPTGAGRAPAGRGRGPARVVASWTTLSACAPSTSWRRALGEEVDQPVVPLRVGDEELVGVGEEHRVVRLQEPSGDPAHHPHPGGLEVLVPPEGIRMTEQGRSSVEPSVVLSSIT